jgi:DNA-binding NarL/FixJ family response regulator
VSDRAETAQPGAGRSAPAGKIRVLIADDHPMVRQGLRVFLEVQGDMEVVGEAADGAAAARMAAELRPDVLLLDLIMPGVDGLGALELLAGSDLEVRALIVTSFGDHSGVAQALRAGARGYLSKDLEPSALAAAIRAVAAGHVLLSPEAAAALAAGNHAAGGDPVNGAVGSGPGQNAAGAQLTAREREVLQLLAEGKSNRDIARLLTVSEKTVKTHVSSVLMKLGVSDRTQAALWAVRHD